MFVPLCVIAPRPLVPLEVADELRRPRRAASIGEAAVRRVGFLLFAAVAALLATAQPAAAQGLIWHANPNNPVYCDVPVTVNDQGVPFDPPLQQSIGRMIQFEVPIRRGVHERFDVELVAVEGLHQLPPNTTNPVADFFARHPQAHFAYQFAPIATINDCDGNGVYALGPGNPPCWGAPVATIRTDVVPAPLPADIRSSVPFNCVPLPRFIVTVSAPPLLNGGVFGIRIRGENRGLLLAMSAYADNQMVSGHAWVHFMKKPLPAQHIGFASHRAFGKWNPAAVVMWGPGVILNDRFGFFDYSAVYPVTVAEYNAAARVVNRDILAPPRFHVPFGTCIVWAAEVMNAAGCPLPDTHEGIFPTPNAFVTDCARIVALNGGKLGRCGYIISGPRPNLNTVGPGANPRIIEEELLTDPEGAAMELGFELHRATLGTATLRTGAPLNLEIDRPEDSLVFVNFGDGPSVFHESGPMTHAYPSPGEYEVRVMTLQQGRVTDATLTVHVQPKGSKGATVHYSIPGVPPVDPGSPSPPIAMAAWERTFPADVNADWIADGNDLALVLAEWGSTDSTPTDIDGDGVVDANDLAIVLAGWGTGPG